MPSASLTFVGTGEAFDPELPNTSLLYRGALAVLFDCGYSVPHAFWRISRDPSLLDAVYITHQHADHSFGLPALLLWMRLEGRSRPLEVIGGPGIDRWLNKLLDLGYPKSYRADRCYPIEPVSLAPGEVFERCGTRLSNAKSEHSVRNLSVRLEASSHVLCYSGDGAPSAATRELYRGADVLVHECYAAVDPHEGHASLPMVLGLADACDVSTLCLLHLAAEEKQQIAARAESTAQRYRIILPTPGQTLEL